MVKIIKFINIDTKEAELTLAAESLELEANAWDSKFYNVNPKKITATVLLLGFWMMQQVAKNTLRNWAVQIGDMINKTVHKNSVDERLNEQAVELGRITLKIPIAIGMNLKVDKNIIKKEKKNYTPIAIGVTLTV